MAQLCVLNVDHVLSNDCMSYCLLIQNITQVVFCSVAIVSPVVNEVINTFCGWWKGPILHNPVCWSTSVPALIWRPGLNHRSMLNTASLVEQIPLPWASYHRELGLQAPSAFWQPYQGTWCYLLTEQCSHTSLSSHRYLISRWSCKQFRGCQQIPYL